MIDGFRDLNVLSDIDGTLKGILIFLLLQFGLCLLDHVKWNYRNS